MFNKVLALSFLLSFVISAAEAKTKPEDNLKEPIPQNNPWDPRNSSNPKDDETLNEHKEGEAESGQLQTDAEDNRDSSN